MSGNDKPSYYAIITAAVRYDSRLSASQKLMFAEITALSNKYGYCMASNSYFARLYDVDIATVSRWVAKLTASGHIYAEVCKEKGNQRRLYPLDKIARGVLTKKSIGVLTKTSTAIDEKVKGGIDEKVKHNNTSDNTIFINVNTSNFIDFWNSKKHLPKIQKFTQARLNRFHELQQESLFIESWQQIIDKLDNSKYHTGRIEGKKWKASVDWLFKGDNWLTILETVDSPADIKTAQAQAIKQRREKELQRYRDEYSGYLSRKDKGELEKMKTLPRWKYLNWLIDEILAERYEKYGPV